MRSTRRAVLLLAVALVFVLGSTAPALAHTELVHWAVEPDPAAGGERLLLRYTEPIDGAFLTVSLVDLQGAAVRTGAVGVDQSRRTDGWVSLSGVPAGVYTVAWWTRAQDGDPSNGSFLLGYRTPVVAADLLPPLGARDPATQSAMFWEDTVWGSLLRWFTYVASALLLGALWFALWTWRPAWGRTVRTSGGDEADRIDLRASRTFRLVALSGAGFFLATSLILLVLQAGFVRYSLLQPVTSAAPTPLAPSALSHQAPYKALAEILSGYNGQVWIARMIVGVAALLAAVLASPHRRRENWRWLLALIVAMGLVFTISLSAHAGAVPQAAWARFLDWAHLVVMGGWIGGLLSLLLAVRLLRTSDAGSDMRFDLAAAVTRRFSAFALGAFIFMAGTGVVEAYLNVGNPALLPRTTYGQALIAKLALFALLFGFGALHRRWTLRSLDRRTFALVSDGRRRTAIEKVLPFEFAAGLSLLVAVALMASLATTRTAWAAHERLGYYSVTTTSEVTATFRAVPGTAGQNAIALDVVDRRLGPPTIGTRMVLSIAGQQIELAPTGTSFAGSPQRFAAAALTSLPELKGRCAFTYERPSYVPVQGTVEVDLFAAPTAAEP